MPTVFAFFGHPGAGKSTLCVRFGALHGVPAVDTDLFMTEGERAAVIEGRYTQAMRVANIKRYAAYARVLLREHPAVALADGLPNDAARRYLIDQLPEARVVFVLVRAPRDLWEERLASREDSPVAIDVATAEAYVRENWEEPAPRFGHETIENGPDASETEAALAGLFLRYASPS